MPTSLESSRPIMAPSTPQQARKRNCSSSDRASMPCPNLGPLQHLQYGRSFSVQPFKPQTWLKLRFATSYWAWIAWRTKALTSQRVALSDEKSDRLSKLALGAKLERALGRRMSSQDAVMRPRPKRVAMNLSISEKKQLAEKSV